MYQSVPVCMYHHVNDHPDKYLTVSVENFRAQMKMLHSEGYTTLSSEEFRMYKTALGKVPRKSVLLTFDDAWLNIYVNAFPILREYKIKFTIFVVSERTARASERLITAVSQRFPPHHQAEPMAETTEAYKVVCSWDHLREMIKSGLCSVENHTATHGHLEDIKLDISKGKHDIESELGIITSQLAWPRGKFDRKKIKTARQLGVNIAYTTRRGVNLPLMGALRISRFTVDDFGAEPFKKYLKIFSSPIFGFVYARLKPDRRRKKLLKWIKNK